VTTTAATATAATTQNEDDRSRKKEGNSPESTKGQHHSHTYNKLTLEKVPFTADQ